MTLPTEVDEILERLYWEIHVHRFDKQDGKVGGPDNFYNGIMFAKRIIRNYRAEEKGVEPL